MTLIGLGLVALALILAPLLVRRRRLAPDEIVMVDGIPHRVAAVLYDGSKLAKIGLEPLEEYLTRTLRVGKKQETLFEALIHAGWRPPGMLVAPGDPVAKN